MKDRQFTTYTISNPSGALYVGSTADLPRRLKQHNAGHGCAFTRDHDGPWHVIRSQHHTSRALARLTEHKWHHDYTEAGHQPLGPAAVMSDAKARRIEKRETRE